jgi:uncharacterized protein (DUF1330 family)/uncharacterized protein YndB with AHSA1/START domain
VSVYALNLFDLAANDDYRAYSRRSVEAVGKHGGTVVALGRLAGAAEGGDTDPRQVMVVVEWPSHEAFDAFVADPDHADLHPLREHGTERYLWWLYERLDDLRPLFAFGGDGVVRFGAERMIDHDPGVVWPVAADARRLADWMWGVDAVEVSGHTGAGLRHVVSGEWVTGQRFEIERVCEVWEPQALVRWRDVVERLDGEPPADPWHTGSWLELRLEPDRLGTRVRLEGRQVPSSDEWAERLCGSVEATSARLAESLERLEAVLDGARRDGRP